MSSQWSLNIQMRVRAQLSTDGNGNVKIECPNAGKKFAAEEISALVLRKLIDDSAKFLNDKARCRPACLVAWCSGAASCLACDCRCLPKVVILAAVTSHVRAR